MKKNRAGFSLVEIIISMVIMAIAFYSVISVFITSGAKGGNVEVFTVAQLLAEGKLEETMMRDFVDVTSEAETNFSGGLQSYSYNVAVAAVSGEALDVPAAGGEFRKIQVNINHPQLASPVSLESIRADY